MRKVYLAGPDVFFPDALEFMAKKAEMAARYGLQALNPGDNILEFKTTAEQLGFAINAADEALMDEADAIIANLTPFRGTSADVGTAYELGYMAAQGKPLYGYTNDARVFSDRIDLWNAEAGAMHVPDEAKFRTENFSFADNLMLVGGIIRRGGELVIEDVAPAERFTSLVGFEKCLKLLAARFDA